MSSTFSIILSTQTENSIKRKLEGLSVKDYIEPERLENEREIAMLSAVRRINISQIPKQVRDDNACSILFHCTNG